MKKIYMILAAITLLSMSLNAQQNVTVANGSATNTYVPVYGYWYDAAQQNQMIYSADLLGIESGSEITSITFYPSDGIKISGGNLRLSLGTPSGTWTTNGYGTPDGPVSGAGNTLAQVTPSTSMSELTFTLTTPYIYNGGDLLVQIDTDAGTDASMTFIGQEQSSNVSYWAYGYSSISPRGIQTFLPKATFTYNVATTDPTIIANPTSVSISSIPGGTATETVSVTGLNLTSGITTTISGTDASLFSVSPTSLGTTGGSLTITYSPTAVGNHTATLTLSSTGAQDVTITLNGECTQKATICDGTDNNSFLPIYGYYNDDFQVNQMIYPESELTNLVGKKLTSMTFYATDNLDANLGTSVWTVKLGTTTQASFANTLSSITRLVPDDVTAVIEGYSITTGIKTMTITFTTPFEYNGGNLLVDFQSTTDGGYATTTFYGVNQNSNTGYNSYNSTSAVGSNGHYSSGGVRAFLPKVTFTYEDSQPRHDLGITLSEPTAVTAGENATITATVTNHGNQTETGYTVTFSDGTNTFSTQTGGTLAPGATETFTATYTTSAAGTVTITANVACTGDADATNDEATTNLTVNAPVHDLGIALTATDEVVGGNDVTLTATVTNTGDLTETGYTVTFSDGTTTFSTQTGGTLAPGATETFTATYTTTAAQGGTSVTFTATVTCTGDADATNDEATASTAVILLPPPTNVVATPDGANATVTWNAPVIAPVVVNVTEDFEDTSVFPSFSTGGIDANTHTGAFGDWTLYDATGGCVVYGSKQLDYDNESVPLAWFVFKPSGATASEDYPNAVPHDVHSGAQYLESICPTSSSSAAGVSDHWLISPELSGNAQTISWWDAALTTSYVPETYEIWVSTTNNTAPGSFTKLADYSISYETWAQQSLQLPEGTKYFAIRHTSNDKFGLLIDDVTYEGLVPGVQPTSYNVYLDGTLVGNVDANDPLTYDFNNLADGDYTVEISAVYPLGESALVPAQFTINTKIPTLEISPETQTIDDTAAGTLTVTGTDIDGNISVSAANDWSLNPTSLSSNGGNVNVTYTGTDLSATTTVTASATGATDVTATVNYVADLYIVGNFGSGWDFNNGTHMSYNNGIYTATLTANANSYILFARLLGNNNPWGSRDVFGPDSNGNWWMTGNSNGGNLNLNDDNCIYFQDGGTYTITIDANNGTFTITRVLEGQTATPTINYTTDDEYVTITATGDGTVTLNVPGYGSFSGEGEVSVTIPRGYADNTITVTATAQEAGKEVSETESRTITIPAGSDWVQMDGTYSATDLLSFTKDGEDIMLVDQFLASTLNNAQPDHYTYTLRQTVNGETNTSTPVNIPVYKTNSSIQGLYTQNQVDGDTDMGLKAGVLNTEMDYDVNPDHNVLYYSLYRGDLNETYPAIDEDSRISQLQKFEDNTSGTVQYFMFESHTSGVAPRYDHLGNEIAERLDTNWVEGAYNDQLAYVPVIWTFGLYSGREDGKNNSYGSDIKREYLGKVEATISGEYTAGNAYGTWTVNGTEYCVFHPTINVTGYLPQEGVTIHYNDGDEATYVPYKCRAWCTTEGIHDFVKDSEGHLTDNGTLDVPYLLGEAEFGNDLTATIGGDWTGLDNDPQSTDVRDQWSFGLPSTTNPASITYVIRFYYKKDVTEGNAGTGSKLRDGDSQEYFIVQTSGTIDEWVVGLNEFANGIVPVSVTYVNPQGMQSSRPFDGVNIVVTRYNDGTTRTTKIIR